MRKWRPYRIGGLSLGQLKGEAVAVWREGGTRRRFRLGVWTEAEGRTALDRFARRKILATTGRSVAEIWSAYIADRTRDGKDMRDWDLRWPPARARFGALDPSEITADLCRAYARERFDAGRRPATVVTELVRLRSALSWAQKMRIIDVAPYIWTPSTSPPRARVATPEEVARLIECAPTHHIALFILLAITTGARHRAILELTWDRVDAESGRVDFRVPAERDPMSKRGRKGRAVVEVPGLVRAALAEARAGALTDHVIEWDGGPVDRVTRGFGTACRKAGVSGITPHTLRHTCATWAAESGQPMAAVARLLGHQHEATTERVYAKPTGEAAGIASTAVAKRLRIIR
jgi:integrase